MAREPFMPLFFGDFLSATSLWDGEQQALYLLLLAHQWSSGALPPDPTELARVIRYEPKRFEKLWKKVGPKFHSTPGGLVNARLEEHRARTIELSSKNSVAGRAGAAARWRKDGVRHQSANGETIAQRHQSANGSIPSHPIPSQNSVENPSQDTRVVPLDARPHPRAREELPDGEILKRFQSLKDTYPPAPARSDWIGAERKARQLVLDGLASWDELQAGVERYAALVRATGRLVLNPSRFFGDEDRPWAQVWPIPGPQRRSNPEDTDWRPTE